MKVRRFAFGHDPSPRAPRGDAPDSGPRPVRTTLPLAADAPRATPTWRQGRTTVLLPSEHAPAPPPTRTVLLHVPAPAQAPAKTRRPARRIRVALLVAAGLALYVGALFAILAPLPGTRRVRVTAAASAALPEPPPSPALEEPSAPSEVAVSTTPEPPPRAPASASALPLTSSAPLHAPTPPRAAASAAPRRRAAPPRRSDGEITNPWGYD